MSAAEHIHIVHTLIKIHRDATETDATLKTHHFSPRTDLMCRK